MLSSFIDFFCWCWIKCCPLCIGRLLVLFVIYFLIQQILTTDNYWMVNTDIYHCSKYWYSYAKVLNYTLNPASYLYSKRERSKIIKRNIYFKHIIFYHIYFNPFCVYVEGEHVLQQLYRCQRTTCWIQYFSITKWVPRIQTRSLG